MTYSFNVLDLLAHLFIERLNQAIHMVVVWLVVLLASVWLYAQKVPSFDSGTKSPDETGLVMCYSKEPLLGLRGTASFAETVLARVIAGAAEGGDATSILLEHGGLLRRIQRLRELGIFSFRSDNVPMESY